jgi:putative DNA primase/helicase
MNERVIFQSAVPLENPYRSAGTLKSWQKEVGANVLGNSRLMLALSAGFAGPLLQPLSIEGGGFHFRGGSSTGKTTALHAAGSIWGGGGINGYVGTWRATSNGLEGIAALHCDTLLCLDEIGQIDAREAGQVAYMLSNGQGKARAGRGGEARKAAEWRVLFLSSGEISLAQKMAEDSRNRRVMAGQEVRIVDIAADAGAGMGIFEELHGFTSPDAFARHLKAASTRNYGHPSTVYLENLVDDLVGNIDRAASLVKAFQEENMVAGADGQVSRVLARFALAAASGELALEFGVLPWKSGDAFNAAKTCFHAWLVGRGGTEAAEDREAISAVRHFLELHGASRFELIQGEDPEHPEPTIDSRIINRAGYVRHRAGEREYIFLPEVWKEVCAGMDAGRVARVLVERGFMQTGSDGKPQTKQRLPGMKNSTRCYVVSSGILADDD